MMRDCSDQLQLDHLAIAVRERTMILRRTLLALSLACLGCAAMPSADAAPANAWDGTWTGKLNDQASMSIVVADGNAVTYEVMGAPIGIKFSKATDIILQFGDPDHYRYKLTRTGKDTAAATYFGRSGSSVTQLTRAH
jgi:hypothetical protein